MEPSAKIKKMCMRAFTQLFCYSGNNHCSKEVHCDRWWDDRQWLDMFYRQDQCRVSYNSVTAHSFNPMTYFNCSNDFIFFNTTNFNNLPNFFKKSHAHILQNFQHMVGSSMSSFFKRRLGLENPMLLGLYCIVIRNRSESKCALSTALTSYSVVALCYGRVGAEYNSWLPVNNARRLVTCGFLTTRSPNLTTAVV